MRSTECTSSFLVYIRSTSFPIRLSTLFLLIMQNKVAPPGEREPPTVLHYSQQKALKCSIFTVETIWTRNLVTANRSRVNQSEHFDDVTDQTVTSFRTTLQLRLVICSSSWYLTLMLQSTTDASRLANNAVALDKGAKTAVVNRIPQIRKKSPKCDI